MKHMSPVGPRLSTLTVHHEGRLLCSTTAANHDAPLCFRPKAVELSDHGPSLLNLGAKTNFGPLNSFPSGICYSGEEKQNGATDTLTQSSELKWHLTLMISLNRCAKRGPKRLSKAAQVREAGALAAGSVCDFPTTRHPQLPLSACPTALSINST